jgi:hypothetical protein
LSISAARLYDEGDPVHFNAEGVPRFAGQDQQ